MVSGSTEFCTFSSCQEEVVPCSNRISWNTSSEFISFFFKLLIGFNLVNLAAMLKFINISLMWYAFPLMKKWGCGSAFF